MHELLIEPRRTEKNYWSDLWRFRETLLHSRMLRHQCSLQTNRDRRDLGDSSSPPCHGHFYGRVWPARQDAIQWRPEACTYREEAEWTTLSK